MPQGVGPSTSIGGFATECHIFAYGKSERESSDDEHARPAPENSAGKFQIRSPRLTARCEQFVRRGHLELGAAVKSEGARLFSLPRIGTASGNLFPGNLEEIWPRSTISWRVASRCVVRLGKERPRSAGPGSLILLAHNDSHFLGSDATLSSMEGATLIRRQGAFSLRAGGKIFPFLHPGVPGLEPCCRTIG